MSCSASTTLDPLTGTGADPIVEQLIEHFGHDVAVWVQGDEGYQSEISLDSPKEGEDAAQSSELQAVLADSCPTPTSPQAIRLQGDRDAVVVPLAAAPCTRLATVLCHRTATPHVLAIAQLTLKLHKTQRSYDELQQEFEVCTVQINDDFEELSFLRSIAEQLEMSDLSKNLVEMARTVLPLLKTSIKAEAVVLLLPAEEGAESVTPGEPALWCGPQSFDEQTCMRVVNAHYAAASEAPVVKNYHQHSAEETQTYPGVQAFVLAPISKGGYVMGWILAVNRAYRAGFEDANFLSHLNHHEFGTSEAGLVASAASMLASQGRNHELYREREELLVRVVRSLVNAIEAKDPYTCGHSERVALYGKALAQALGLDHNECEKLYLTGLLHDIGKIGVSDATLGKPGKLTDEEFDEIKRHPDFGWGILHELDQFRYVLPGVVHHHEQFDGSGYPDGLAGEEIPRDGRILAVADAFDAMTSDRPYRQGMPVEKAIGILRGGAGSQWDAHMIEEFMRIMPDILAIRQSYCRPAPLSREAPVQD